MARVKKKKKGQEQEININQKFENIKVLVRTGRAKEAIAYIYLIYNDLMTRRFSKPRRAHQTIREYAITCVNELGQKPETIYPFIKKIEDIIYGGLEPTNKEINDTIQLFSNLYTDVTGKQLPAISF
ncbi:MAG: hypothetical protein ACTSRH_05385 [Promethearchaeota archaeon]